MNLELELKGWSDGILTAIHQEEDCSPEFRDAVVRELCSRTNTMVKLTSEMLHGAGTSGFCGWTKAQLSVLGIGWPAPSGWLQGLVGREIPYWKFKKFMDMKGRKRITSLSSFSSPSLQVEP